VYSLVEELSIIENEQRNGMFRAQSYIIAKFVLTLPIIIIFAICALGIPQWVIQQYPFELYSFSTAVLLWSVMIYLYESLAECLAVWIENKVLGVLIYLAFWILSFFFSGLFLPLDKLFWPIKIFYYISPFSYYLRSMFYVLYSHVHFDPCDRSINLFTTICVESGEGTEVLDALHKIFQIFENKNTLIKDIGVFALIIFLFKGLYVIGVVWKGCRVSTLKLDKSMSPTGMSSTEVSVSEGSSEA